MIKKDENHPENREGEEDSQVEALPEPSAEEKLADELKETADRYLRLAAEFENYKKTSAKERITSLKFANEGLIISLLPILDNLEQAVAAGKNIDGAAAKNLLIGVDMVLKQSIEVLQKFGVEFYISLGQHFDPTRHEAVDEREDDSVEPGTVVAEYQRGCMLNGRLLRAARVAVAKKPREKEQCDS